MKASLSPAKAVIATLASASFFLLPGCSDRADSTSDIRSFEVRESIKSADKSYRFMLDTDTCYLTISTTMQWPEELADYDISTLRDSLVSRTYGVSTRGDVNEAIDKFLATTGEYGFPDSIMTSVDYVGKPTETVSAYSVEASAKVLELSERLITYQIVNFSYLGGAHPNTYVSAFSYDLKQGKVLTAENLFVPGSDAKLLEIVKNNLASMYNVSPDNLTDAGLLTNDISLAKIVYVLNGELVFHYNQYDIAPYAMGDINVEVSPYEVRDLLSDVGKAALGPLTL